MSNNGSLSTLSMYTKVKGFGVQAGEAYHSVGKRFRTYVEKKHGTAQGLLASRVYSSAIEVLISVCALTGVFAVPACVVLATKRIFPLHSVVIEAFRLGGSKEALAAKWREVKESYKSSLKNTIAPALMVALTIDTLFCTVFGLITMNPICFLRACALSGPAAFYIYKTLVNHFQGEAKRLFVQPDEIEHSDSSNAKIGMSEIVVLDSNLDEKPSEAVRVFS